MSQAHNSFLSTSGQSLTHEGSCFIQTCPASPVVWWWMLNNYLSHDCMFGDFSDLFQLTSIMVLSVGWEEMSRDTRLYSIQSI